MKRRLYSVTMLAIVATLLLTLPATAASKPAITVSSFSFVIEATAPPWWGTATATGVSWQGSPAYIELGFALCDWSGRCTWRTDFPSTRIAVNARTHQPVSSMRLSVNLYEKGAVCAMGVRLLDRKGNALGAPLLDSNWMKSCPDSVHA